jgi:gamma-glutamylcyclotransferase
MPKYFAYGSNLSYEQICDRCPSHEFVSVAELREYRLAFTRYSKNRACGVADVVPAQGESVWGVVYELSEADLAELDGQEGAHLTPPAYMRLNVQVVGVDGQVWDAITYEVANKAADVHVPSTEYLGLIKAGALKWDLPQAYQEGLAKIEVQG